MKTRDRKWDFTTEITVPITVEFSSEGWTDLNHDGSVTLDETYEKVCISRVQIDEVPLLYEEWEPMRRALLQAFREEIENAIIDHMED